MNVERLKRRIRKQITKWWGGYIPIDLFYYKFLNKYNPEFIATDLLWYRLSLRNLKFTGVEGEYIHTALVIGLDGKVHKAKFKIYFDYIVITESIDKTIGRLLDMYGISNKYENIDDMVTYYDYGDMLYYMAYRIINIDYEYDISYKGLMVDKDGNSNIFHIIKNYVENRNTNTHIKNVYKYTLFLTVIKHKDGRVTLCNTDINKIEKYKFRERVSVELYKDGDSTMLYEIKSKTFISVLLMYIKFKFLQFKQTSK
ncbi:MAG: hypothetical protein ACRDD8_11300 [Bacteroidales bacterium]